MLIYLRCSLSTSFDTCFLKSGDLIENRGGNSETDENENGLERPENESIDSDVSEASEVTIYF